MKSIQEKTLLALYDREHEKGLAALAEGDVPLFTGFPESSKNRFHVSFHFSDYSLHYIRNTIVTVLEGVERAPGIEFSLAIRDFPLHSTLLQGTYSGSYTKERDDLFVYARNRVEALVREATLPRAFLL